MWLSYRKKKYRNLLAKTRDRVDTLVKRERRCCCAFGKLAKQELATSNQPYTVVAKASPLTSRASRLALFYLGLLLEFALCALFYNLSSD